MAPIAPSKARSFWATAPRAWMSLSFSSLKGTKATIDGEWFARKGVGRVRIEPKPGFNVDVFATHTAADPDPSHGYTNEYYRNAQVKELMASYVSKSTAEIVILGGDFNAGPEMEDGKPVSLQDHVYFIDFWGGTEISHS